MIRLLVKCLSIKDYLKEILALDQNQKPYMSLIKTLLISNINILDIESDFEPLIQLLEMLLLSRIYKNKGVELPQEEMSMASEFS